MFYVSMLKFFILLEFFLCNHTYYGWKMIIESSADSIRNAFNDPPAD